MCAHRDIGVPLYFVELRLDDAKFDAPRLFRDVSGYVVLRSAEFSPMVGTSTDDWREPLQ